MVPYPQIKAVPNTIYEGDDMILTCDTTHVPPRDTTDLHFAFSRDGRNVQQFSVSDTCRVPSAQLEDSGNYTCDVTTYRHRVIKRSNVLSIQIEDLFSIPQIRNNQPSVTEDNDMTLTCDTQRNPARSTTELQFAFYRDGRNVQVFRLSDTYRVPSAQLKDSGLYTCDVRTSSGSVRKRSDVLSIQVEELFSFPEIKKASNTKIDGDDITLTCDTTRAPLRDTRGLQFAFYRNGRNVQEFNLSDTYRVPSAQLEDSGNYTCDVRTSTGSVRKMSDVLSIPYVVIEDYTVQNIIRLALSGCILAIAACFIFYHNKSQHEASSASW
ncbi:Fc receptor-like protein 6 [Mixophyes fleayi]|uniref:Fc receptor-like protein 6 n=1 Tax=Mixophyes fleayi TaxID=3061075 RepID=UPI003F4D84B1